MTREAADPLERALATLLRPVVRLALKRGLAFGRFAEILKRSYVEAARRDFAVPGRKLTISRVAVLTGLTRKEASRLMNADTVDTDSSGASGGDPAEERRVRRQVNRAARVVTAWVESRDYHDDQGEPLALPFESADGPSFAALVAAHGGDVPPRAVLDELLRVGAIERQEDDRLALVARAYVPATDDAGKLDILGTDVADLAAAIEHNLAPDARGPFFQRKVAYDNLPAESLPAIRALLSERGQALLETLNAEMSAHDRGDAPANDDGGRHRAMVGLYYFEDREDDEDHD